MYRIIVTAMLVWSASLWAGPVPEPLQGQWVLAEDATRQAVSLHHQADEALERYLPVLLKRMRRAAFVFEADTIRFRQDGREQVFAVTRQQYRKGRYDFHVKVDGASLTLSVIQHPQGLISVESSDSDDLALYRWRRGDEPETGNEDQDANALMRSQLN